MPLMKYSQSVIDSCSSGGFSLSDARDVATLQPCSAIS